MSIAKGNKLIPKAKVHHEHRNWAFLLDKMTCLFWILLFNEKECWLKMNSSVMEIKDTNLKTFTLEENFYMTPQSVLHYKYRNIQRNSSFNF